MTSILRVAALTLLRGNKFNYNAICVPGAKFSSSTGSNDSNNNDAPPKGKDDLKNGTETKVDEPSEATKAKQASEKRLQKLLEELNFDSVYKTVKNIETAKPKGYGVVKDVKLSKKQRDPKFTQNINDAAALVAEAMGGDTDKTKNELLSKLKNKSETNITDLLLKGTPRKATKTRKPIEERDEIVTVDTVKKKIVDEVAESEFLTKMKSKSANSTDAADIVSQLKIEKFDSVRSTPRRYGDKEFIRSRPHFKLPERRERDAGVSRNDPAKYSGSVKLFDGERLGIFSVANADAECRNSLNIWNSLEQHEIDLITSQPPKNYYEKMIQWTEQGKIWKFPIDNEQGLDEEATFSFEQHVFLDQLLESWCPKTGPIRIFMELVCVGLSKNPYLTVKQKQEHIEWYRKYFDEKKDILERMVVQQNQQKLVDQQQNSTPLIN